MKNKLLICLLTCMSIQLGFGQQDACLKIIQVNEQRHTGDSKNRMHIIVKIDSLKIDTEHLIKIKDSIVIVDNSGTKLKVFSNYPSGGYFQRDNEISIGFEAARRDVTAIEKIEGILEYFTISEEYNSKLTIPNFMNQTHKNLLLDIASPKLILINYNSVKKVYDTDDYYPAIKRLQREAGLGKTLEEADVFFSNMFYFQNNNPNLELNFYIEDPKEIIYKILVYNGEGKQMNTNYSNSGNRYRIGLSEEPLPDWKLEIQIKTEQAIKEIPFQFQNIKLP